MEYVIKGRNLEVSDALRSYVEKRIKKLDRFLPNIDEVEVDLSIRSAKSAQDRQAAQITLRAANGLILRAEERSDDLRASFDAALDKMVRQIKRYKGKHWQSQSRPVAAVEEAVVPEEEEETTAELVRIKRFETRPMDVEEAIEQMELLGHDFFLFYNAEDEQFNVVYRRAVLEQVGGFDERYLKGQDAELSFRVMEAGYELRFELSSRVGHYHATRWLPYLRTQRQQGYWRVWLHLEHRGHSTGDSYSNLLDHVQPPLAMLSVITVPLAWLPQTRWVPAAWPSPGPSARHFLPFICSTTRSKADSAIAPCSSSGSKVVMASIVRAAATVFVPAPLARVTSPAPARKAAETVKEAAPVLPREPATTSR